MRIRNFAELSDEEKLERFSKLGEQLQGDYIKFAGRGPDSLMLFELVLDKDNRFAFRTKHIPGTVNVDSLEIQLVVRGDGLSNKCIGRWEDQGNKIKLRFLLCSKDIFDLEKNGDAISVIDDRTILLDKDTEEIWVMGTVCRRVFIYLGQLN